MAGRPGDATPSPEERRRGTGPRRGAFASLSEAFPDVASRYRALADGAAAAGPLDAQGVALAKFAVSVGTGSSRSVHAHARKALEVGVDEAALAHVVLVALPTIGLPQALDAWRWLGEIVAEAHERTGGSRMP